VTRRFGKNHPIFQKEAQTVAQQTTYLHQFENTNLLHQTTSETSKKPHFVDKNVKHLHMQKVTKKVTISLGYFIFKKLH
jgi:hypothetical protein